MSTTGYRRSVVVFMVIIAGFAALLGRLYQIMLRDGDSMEAMVVSQQSYMFTVAKRRGTIYDCKGVPLTNSATYPIAVVDPQTFADNAALLELLCAHSPVEPAEIEPLIKRGRPFALELASEPEPHEAIVIVQGYRHNTDGTFAPHIIGELDATDGHGRTGIERAYDEWLESGGGRVYTTATLDAARRTIAGLGFDVKYEHFDSAQGVQLTLDSRAQRIAQEAMERAGSGAVIVCEIATGEIKAMVSTPGYNVLDPAAYLESDNGEFVNRALSPYNLGSIFKIVVAAAAIELYDGFPELVYTCEGSIEVGEHDISCHNSGGHGEVDFADAFALSCNPYFITLALEMGLDPILDMARRLGIEDIIELAPGIRSGANTLPESVHPTPPALIANTAIGQGDILINPLSVIALLGRVLGDGHANTPRLVLSLVGDEGSEPVAYSGASEPAGIDERTRALLAELMVSTVSSGTGKGAMPIYGGAGGKTASAETGWLKDDEQVVHGWFAGFFPSYAPKYSVVVVVENGRSGSGSAVPVFKEIADGMLRAHMLSD